MSEKEFMLNVDGRYLFKIADQDEDTVGKFKGYSALGSTTSIVVEMEGGKIRFLPIEQVVYIDVLESGMPEQPKSSKNRDTYYG